MGEEIFRKKSLDKVKSPDNLDDYIHVSNPGMWLLLVSIIILLIGACIWGVFGRMDSTVPSYVKVADDEAICYIEMENVTSIKVGQTVKFENCEAIITGIEDRAEAGCACILSSENLPENGFYEAKVIINTYKPLSFILN